MSKELMIIKEILDNFEKYETRYRLHNETQFIITHREIQILLDYITNLQEENKQLKELCDKYEEEIIEEPQEHKIPEKICTNRIINTKDILEFEMIQNKINAEYTYVINEIIDYLEEIK